MNPAVSEQLFSVPFRHLWSTDFTGEITASLGSLSGLDRFVGDRSNLMLKYFASDDKQQKSTATKNSGLLGNQWPLVLYGNSGTGKTSLAMAIIAELAEHSHRVRHSFNGDGPKPVFLSARDFDRRYRQALQMDSLNEFRQRLLTSVGVVIDDLHQLANKPAVQQELVLILDRLSERQIPFVATMNISPLSCVELKTQLTSRLSGGLSLNVQPPGPAARSVIVNELAASNQIDLDSDAVDLIVNRLDVTVPKLVHFFAQIKNRLRTEAKVDLPTPITAVQLNQLFAKDATDLEQLAQLIIKSVATELHVKVSDLKSNSRKQSIVLARGVAIYLNRVLLGTSFLKIGSYFSGRDHSTVLHAYRKIDTIVKSSDTDSAAIRIVVDRLKKQLTEQFASQLNFF